MAEFKLNRIRYNWKGDWAAATNYTKDDVVRYGSSTFNNRLGDRNGT